MASWRYSKYGTSNVRFRWMESPHLTQMHLGNWHAPYPAYVSERQQLFDVTLIPFKVAQTSFLTLHLASPA